MSAPEKKEPDYEGCAVGCLSLILDFTAMPLLYGWAIVTLWRWFVVAQFGVKPLPLAAAIGLDLIVSLLTAHGFLRKKAEYTATEYTTAIIGKALLPLYALMIGWLVLKVVA